MSKTLNVDFEFNRVTHPNVNLVSCATITESGRLRSFWLHNDPVAQKELAEYMSEFDEIVSYAAVAEARSMFALKLNPFDFNVIDLYLEYKLISNSNNAIAYGNQLVDGKVKYFAPHRNKWDKIAKGEGFKQTYSLAEATYKMLEVIRDTDHKTKMRDLIISDPKEFTEEEKQAILDYGEEDVKDLSRLRKAIKFHFDQLCEKSNLEELSERYLEQAYFRGRYSCHTALMEQNGYPIDYKKLKNFSSQISNIMYDLQHEINGLFPNIKPFRWNRPEQRYSENKAALKKYVIENHDPEKWDKTDKGDLSLSLEAWTKYYDFKHDYPLDNFGAQMVRYYKMKQSIFGFSTSKKEGKKNFWDNVGPDKRVRPYMNHFGAQTSRSQPASTGFMFLKPAWMRALVMPEKGKAIGGIDFASEEFFIQALKSRDGAMIKAYLSGDVYMAFAIQAGLAPLGATKKTHGAIRDLCKSTVLGLGFDMTKIGLAIKLTSDTGKEVTEDEAQKFIDLFYDTYFAYRTFKDEVQLQYEENNCLVLRDGWILWGDNTNFRSVGNFPIQGLGGVIMRYAVDKAFEKGLPTLFTLHDANYIEYNVGEEHKMLLLRDAMREAFVLAFNDDDMSEAVREKILEAAGKIRFDPFAWSPDYKPNSEIILKDHDGSDWKLPVSNIYIDERAIADYEKFSKYFEDRAESLL